MNSGHDWPDRMKRLAEHAPDLNIFSAKFVFAMLSAGKLHKTGGNSSVRSKRPSLKESGPDQPSISRPAKSLH
ncbi:hypothetical protein [Bradyrhizobium sp. WSM2793]|uniref:hypothetical protein n=1 Tax=Bradyrhizobium sp. WSM2793 TaxID=1038866 RepID=UPI0003A51FA3|nr:hypothetical protein [Bradyrhizobium sp. WSM2793]